jgi:hypothetical protein
MIRHTVPHRTQRAPDTCVPTCLGMLLEHVGVSVEQEAIDRVALDKGRGTYGHHKGALETATVFGVHAESTYLKGDPERDLERLLELAKRRPLLVTGRFHHFPDEAGASGHAIVVIGCTADGRTLICHDPHHRKAASGSGIALSIPADQFLVKWSIQHMGWVLWLHDEVLQ